MSKEIDYLDKILNYQPLTLVERTIIECIKEKIQRLESIDNAEPSEALECLEEWKYQINSYIDCSLECGDIDNECYNHLIEDLEQYYTTIEQALLKAQEPKKYLKWEDLEFKEKAIYKRVTLNGELYLLKTYRNFILDFDVVELEKTDGTILFHINQYNLQFFNDLHLEEEE